jgi:hypothetical protein
MPADTTEFDTKDEVVFNQLVEATARFHALTQCEQQLFDTLV